MNWMNCVRLPDFARKEWAECHGLDGLDSEEFDRVIDKIEERLKVTSLASDHNGPNARLTEGCEQLGFSHYQARVNADFHSYNPSQSGYTGFGDQTGSKQSCDRTFLEDAQSHGAEIITSCRVQRIMSEGGQAKGVEAIYLHEDGKSSNVTIFADTVVVAGGSIESPMLLMRSGMGGESVG